MIDAKSGEVIFDKNSQLGLAPASTQKIITSVTAFELLGKDYRYKTKLGYELGELYRGERNSPITKDYLVILKHIFSIYADEDLESKPINKTNLYKYSTTKTK